MSHMISCSRRLRRANSTDQKGAATLVVVMILFFVVTLAAAYASRNLIFEQRTAANQYRSTSAQEAAEAGIEWAVTMLNSGRIDENCVATTDTSKNTFRQRYLDYDAEGKLLPKLPTSGSEPLWSACVLVGTSWTCFCPDRDGALPESLPEGNAAFAVRFKPKFAGTALDRRGAIRVEVNGCASNNMECLKAIRGINQIPCQSTACTLLAQYPALKMPPIAAITTPKSVDVSSGRRLEVYNPDPRTGVAIQEGTSVATAGNLVLGGPPGVPPDQSRVADSKIKALDAHTTDCDQCMFSAVFGLRPETYKQQQGVVKVECGTGGCTSASAGSPLGKALAAARGSSNAFDSASATYKDRGSVVWLSGAGGLTLSAGTDKIGDADAPVTLIVEGPLKIDGPAQIVGVVFAKAAALDSGPGAGLPTTASIRGALITADGVTSEASTVNPGRVLYDSAVVEKVSLLNGTFVRVPSSWRDFP